MAVAFDAKTIEQFHMGKAKVQKSTSTGTEKIYIALKPGYHTMVQCTKNGSTATLAFTGDYTKGGDVDDAVYGADVNTGTDDYQKGHTPGFTGLEIDVTAYVGNVVVIVTQFLIGD